MKLLKYPNTGLPCPNGSYTFVEQLIQKKIMKKIHLVVISVMLITIISCADAKKTEGFYTGTYAIDSTYTYPVSGTIVSGSVEISNVTGNKANMFLMANSPAVSDMSEDVSVTVEGNSVHFNYSKNTTTDFDMISLNGTVTGNSITLHGIMYYSYGNGVGTFTGSK